MSKDFEYCFRSITDIRDTTVVKSQFSSIARTLIWLFGFLEISFLSSLYILDISPLQDVGLVKNFFFLNL